MDQPRTGSMFEIDPSHQISPVRVISHQISFSILLNWPTLDITHMTGARDEIPDSFKHGFSHEISQLFGLWSDSSPTFAACRGNGHWPWFPAASARTRPWKHPVAATAGASR